MSSPHGSHLQASRCELINYLSQFIFVTRQRVESITGLKGQPKAWTLNGPTSLGHELVTERLAVNGAEDLPVVGPEPINA